MSFFKKFTKRKNKNKPEKQEDEGDAPTVPEDSSSFDVDADCEQLKKAFKGLGTDEDAVIDVLCKRNGDQRRQISERYRELYEKDLLKVIESETSGDLEKVLTRLCRDPIEMAAFELREALKDDKDQQAVVELLGTRSNEDVAAIKNKYQEKFGESFENDLGKTGDKNENFRRLLVSVLTVSRNAERIDEEAAKSGAEKLQQPQDGDDNRFDAILASRNYPQVKAVFRAYEKSTSKDVDEEFQREFAGDIAGDLLAAMYAMRNKEAYLASRLYDSMKGVGTKDTMLIRLVTTRCDIDLQNIKKEYLRMYGRSLAKDISKDTSGDYKKALLALIGEDSD